MKYVNIYSHYPARTMNRLDLNIPCSWGIYSRIWSHVQVKLIRIHHLKSNMNENCY